MCLKFKFCARQRVCVLNFQESQIRCTRQCVILSFVLLVSQVVCILFFILLVDQIVHHSVLNLAGHASPPCSPFSYQRSFFSPPAVHLVVKFYSTFCYYFYHYHAVRYHVSKQFFTCFYWIDCVATLFPFDWFYSPLVIWSFLVRVSVCFFILLFRQIEFFSTPVI